MAEKNPANLQWTKQPEGVQKQHTQTSDQTSFGNLQANILSHPLYVGANDAVPHLSPYIPGRFQAPSIQIAPITQNTVNSCGNVLTPTAATAGCISPSFSGTAKSVLTSNPFALQINSTIPSSHLTSEQYHHLNQQQLDLSKIVRALNSGPTASSPSLDVHCPSLDSINVSQKLSPSTSVHTVTKLHKIDLSPNSSGNGGGGIPESLLSTLSASVNPNVHTFLLQKRDVDAKSLDKDQLNVIQQAIESSISTQTKDQIKQILEKISFLKPVEKLFLYLRLPGESPESDPLRQSQNPLGTRSEISHTINWVRSHLEHDPQVSIPKQDVYNDYLEFCERENIKPLSTADFGKVMKQVFPGIRPRRLGTRGNSRYCYAAMRKTTKLSVPELPAINDNSNANFEDDEKIIVETEHNRVILGWAEKILNTKVSSAQELANHIRALQAFGNVKNVDNCGLNVASKKIIANELKEGNYNTDLGPLKKRRKKKCKNFSADETSINQVVSPDLKSPTKNSAFVIKSASNVSSRSPLDEPNTTTDTISVKQEIMDSPNSSNSGAQARDNFVHQQIMPINLATDSRTILIKTQPVDEDYVSVAAVKNLTPKFVEAAQVALAQFSEIPVNEKSIQLPSANIKEENTEDYFLTNVFCKKVLKAQQIKGCWNNAGLLATQVNAIPVITTTASTPPPVTTSPIRASNAGISSECSIDNSSTTNYLMGPPAQITATASTSPQNSLENNNGPKVASRNTLLLKAKRQLQTQNAVGSDNGSELTEKDEDLPEDLGLPRERVISICNMDKHELDDYFLPEEENSEEPESELLQYFQQGDAEETLRSLDAAQKIRTITAKQTSKVKNTEDDEETETKEKRARKCLDEFVKTEQNCKDITGSKNTGDAFTIYCHNTNLSSENVPLTLVSAAVGSDSASLTQTYEKHRKSQGRNEFPLDLQDQTNKVLTTLENSTLSNKLQTNSVRKNCIFVPISPNINSKTETTYSDVTSRSLFASPDATKIRSKTAYCKQQSLDIESRDPMIGASRRRRKYSGIITITTSASAPPSPSVLQQRHPFLNSNSSKSSNWPCDFYGQENLNDLTPNSSLMAEPSNSLDLDFFEDTSLNISTRPQNMFSYENSADCSQLSFPMLEVQRSQSVPISQLQRIYSPPSVSRSNYINGGYSICESTVGKANKSQCEIVKLEKSAKNQTESLEKTVVLASDSTALLDEMDVSDLLSSPDFVDRFNNTATTCSQYSSSGYNSTSANTSFDFIGASFASVSRSVPSTPLPHNTKSFSDLIFSEKGHKPAFSQHLSPSTNWSGSIFCSNVNGKYSCSTARSAFDLSKSVPTTPITNPSFRYSPLDIPETPDFLANGNTVDSLDSSFALEAKNSKLSLTTTDIGLNMGIELPSNDFHTDPGIFSSNISVGESINSRSDTDSLMMTSDLLSSL